MGPTIRTLGYHRDPWWDVDGRATRRRRRRRLVAWACLVALAVSIGAVAGEARAATASQGGSVAPGPADVAVTSR